MADITASEIPPSYNTIDQKIKLNEMPIVDPNIKNIRYDDNPLTKWHNEYINILKSEFYKTKIDELLIKKTITSHHAKSIDRKLTILNFIQRGELINNYKRMSIKKYTSTTEITYYTMANDIHIYIVNDNEPFLKIGSGYYHYIMSHTYIMDYLETQCDKFRYSYDRHPNKFDIVW